MFFDMQETTLEGGLISYPDFPYAAVPKQPDQIKQTVIVQGSTSSRNVSVQGTSDRSES